MGLEIRQTYAQIGIETTNARVEMRSSLARLELQQKHAKVNIQSEMPKVLIDQYECFASAGLKNNYDFIREAADNGRQATLEFIGKTAADGNAFAAIENGGNPIRDTSVRDANPQHEFGYGYIPTVGPKFEVTGSLDIQAEPNAEGVNNGVDGTYTPPSLDVQYTPGKVSYYMRQYPSVSINYTSSTIEAYV